MPEQGREAGLLSHEEVCDAVLDYMPTELALQVTRTVLSWMDRHVETQSHLIRRMKELCEVYDA